MARTVKINPVRACLAIAPASICGCAKQWTELRYYLTDKAMLWDMALITFGSVPLATLSC